MNDLSSLKQDLATDVEIAGKRQDALAILEITYATLRGMGFGPDVYSETVFGSDQLILRVDLNKIETFRSSIVIDRDPGSEDVCCAIASADEVEASPETDASYGGEECIDQLRERSFGEIQSDYSEEEKSRLQDQVDQTIEVLGEDLADLPDKQPEAEEVKAESPAPSAVPTEQEFEPDKPAEEVDQKPTADEPGPRLGRWSKADEGKLVDMVVQGRKPQEIAEALGRDVKAVQNKRTRCKADIKVRRAELKKAAKSIEAHVDLISFDPFWDHSKTIRFLENIVKGTGVAGAGAVLRVGKIAAHDRYKVLCPEGSPWSAQQVLDELKARLSTNEEA